MEAATAPVEETAAPAAPRNRMISAVLALVGAVIAGYMFLYSVGAVTSLACGAGGECETVQASPWAAFYGVPVPLIGLIGYALILAASLAGVQPAFVGDRRIAAALLGLSTIAFIFSIYLSAVEAFLIEAWCRWCIASAVVSTLLFLASLPELRRLRSARPRAGPFEAVRRLDAGSTGG
ncbi:MAG: vitamin K epoxide reductase family protein [Longimicrobiales bacterium]